MAQNEMKAKPALPERVRSMEGLGVAERLHAWAVFTIGTPEGDDFNGQPTRPVVDVVADALEKPAPGFRRLGVLDSRSYSGKRGQQIERIFQILRYRARSSKTVLAPPSSSFIDFAPSARFDPYSESQDQPYFRNSAKSSCAEMPSSRSASSSADSSSLWRVGDRRMEPSSLVTKTPTSAPSGSDP